ncbi:MAG: sigma-70 family RNA polymerase sigma factor [Armatimonadetes bacterium]|nr:sigma-70 family RNA polymerase sigma factor [Armatimonadota bacterium]NIM24857.1 sigma-70 family RNA polymerase sigma factor [Armatimonadota bacterium]NIM68747.1 sigma-70 family RNA polymerase sigma factor [Armatimonadota bacterium]NIM76040.1 sigma-70 family RNA polymerase sigma factor [Armatimonadota bacterium]NIN06944.1 sigma-70 family RNA polymerase sigma factor [Armatimonadota bacterium]
MSVAVATCIDAGRRILAESEEARLLARCRSGDRQAQEALVRRYQDRTYRLAYDLLGNHEDALDASQEALVAMLRSLPSFRGEARFHTWFYRLTVNICLMQRRRLLTRTRILTNLAARELDSPSQFDPESAALGSEIQSAVREHLRQLPPALRAIIVLREIEGFSYDEIAEVLRIPLGTVQSRLSRARSLLRKALLADDRIPSVRPGGEKP